MFFILFLVTFSFSQASVWDNLNASIAVVEYQPYHNGTYSPRENVVANSVNYMLEMYDITNQSDIDMIIFPESTLENGPETAIEIEINTPCINTTICVDSLIHMIPHTALTLQTYVVINLVEKSKCEESDESQNCKDYGYHFYNTDVVFNRDGTVINKYRKYNLFGERELEQPEQPDQVIIKTDFGVTFGIFTCFDILFKSPAEDLLSQGVDAVIFPTMWFSELPFLTAIQTQQMWAQTHDVTLFAAGANNPFIGSGGSGVYRGAKGAALRGIVATGGTQVFIFNSTNGEVPPLPSEDIDTLAKEMDAFYLKRDTSIDDYTSLVLNTSTADYHTQLCHGNDTSENQICCDFSIKMSVDDPQPNLNSYTYHLVAYSGVRSFDKVYNGSIELCAILACLNSSLSTCGKRFNKYEEVQWPVTFEEITIKTNFENNENRTQYPNSLLSSIRPIDASKTVWDSAEIEENDKTLIERSFSIMESQNRLLTFGIYGRNFDLDPKNDDFDDGKGSGKNIFISGFLLTFSLLSVFLY